MLDPGLAEALAHFTPDDVARGAAHAQASDITGLFELAADVVLLVALSFSRFGAAVFARCAGLAARVPRGRISKLLGDDWLSGALFLGLVAIFRDVLALPTTYWRDYLFAHELGLSHETLASFLRDGAAHTFLLAVSFAVLGAALGAVRSRWPKRWWLAVGLLAGVFLLVDSALDPLRLRLDFDVKPLADVALVTRLDALAERHGDDLGAIEVIDASRFGTKANAFLTGLGATKRLVLTDTLLDYGPEAVAGAVAHEIGHRRSERLPWRLGAAALFLVVALWAFDRSLAVGATRIERRTPGAAAAAVRSVPATLAAFSLLLLAVSPVRAALDRAEEREADAVELAERHDYDAYIDEQVRLTRSNAAQPQPGDIRGWLLDHPSPAERIALALWYKRRMLQAIP